MLNKHFASRSLLDSSALCALDFDEALLVAEFVDEACEGLWALCEDEDLLVANGAGVPVAVADDDNGEAFVASGQNID